jgi:hypothetical protein
MARIFLVFALAASFFGPNSCSPNAVDEVSLPADVAAISTPFIAAIKRGDTKRVEQRMATSFVDDSRAQFADMSAILKTAPPLVPALYVPKQKAFGTDENEVSVTYAAHDGKKWISAEIRMYRANQGLYEIEYWDVKAADKPPALLAHAKQMKTFTTWLMVGLAVSALLGLALLIWIVKRRTHIIAPDLVQETRRVAATVRDAQ